MQTDSKEDIEKQIFVKNLPNLKNTDLSPDLAEKLLRELRQDIFSGETKAAYETKILSNALKEMNINDN